MKNEKWSVRSHKMLAERPQEYSNREKSIPLRRRCALRPMKRHVMSPIRLPSFRHVKAPFFCIYVKSKKNIRNCDISSTDSQKIALNRCFNGGTTKHNLRRLLLCSTKSEFDSPARKNTGLRIPEPHIRPVHSAMFLVDSHSGRPAKPIADVYFLRKTRLLTLKKV